MRKLLLASLLGLALAAPPAGAISIALLPSAVSAAVGGTVDLAVVVSGLDTSSSSLGSYDLDLTFDSSLLTFASLDFGDALSDVLDPSSSIQIGPFVGGGVIDFAEVSLLSHSELQTIQSALGDPLTIATLHFTVSAEGTSSVAISQALAAGGSTGGALPVTSLAGARVTGVAAGAVPEPGAAALFALGLLAVLQRGARRRTR
jgi:hypothetical protein